VLKLCRTPGRHLGLIDALDPHPSSADWLHQPLHSFVPPLGTAQLVLPCCSPYTLTSNSWGLPIQTNSEQKGATGGGGCTEASTFNLPSLPAAAAFLSNETLPPLLPPRSHTPAPHTPFCGMVIHAVRLAVANLCRNSVKKPKLMIMKMQGLLLCSGDT